MAIKEQTPKSPYKDIKYKPDPLGCIAIKNKCLGRGSDSNGRSHPQLTSVKSYSSGSLQPRIIAEHILQTTGSPRYEQAFGRKRAERS